MEYLPRVVDRILGERLASVGAVLIEGPKACGKTRTAERQAASAVHLDTDTGALAALDIDPGLVLDGAAPRLIDEWQLGSTVLWNQVRSAVDRRASPGQFLLTGSSVPPEDVRRHSGAGRFARLTMRPMSLFESGDSTGEISLAGLLAGDRPRCPEPGVPVRRLVELIVRGGWPLHLGMDAATAARATSDYLANVRDVDIPRLEGVARDPHRLDRLMIAVARNVATEAGPARLAADVGSEADRPLARTTVYDYLDALRRLLIIEPQPAWATHLRSRARIRSSEKLHFVDPSLAAAALGAGTERLLADLEYTGLLFESLVVRDTRVFADAVDATVHHYRDSSGLEIDLVIQCRDGRWGAIEVKLGQGRVEAAATTLVKFAATVDTSRIGAPTFLAVVTGGGYGYVRPDGVVVVPVGAWGP